MEEAIPLPMLTPGAVEIIPALREFQDMLGEYNDICVHQKKIISELKNNKANTGISSIINELEVSLESDKKALRQKIVLNLHEFSSGVPPSPFLRQIN